MHEGQPEEFSATVSEAAERLEVNERRVLRWILRAQRGHAGGLQARKVAGSHGQEWRILPSSIEAKTKELGLVSDKSDQSDMSDRPMKAISKASQSDKSDQSDMSDIKVPLERFVAATSEASRWKGRWQEAQDRLRDVEKRQEQLVFQLGRAQEQLKQLQAPEPQVMQSDKSDSQADASDRSASEGQVEREQTGHVT